MSEPKRDKIPQKSEDNVSLDEYCAQKFSDYLDENPGVRQTVSAVYNGLTELVQFISQPQVMKFFLDIKDLPEKRKAAVLEMSRKGWFLNKHCFFNFPKESESIDDFMTAITEEKYGLIKVDVLRSYPERHLILSNAFDLYENENYIACIPLFITQIDGICHDAGLNHYFTDKKHQGKRHEKPHEYQKFPKYVEYLMENERVDVDKAYREMFSAIVKNSDRAFISLNTSRIPEINELTILNRHGILHGLKEFSGYGTRKNAQKIISLVCYIGLIIELLKSND